jgi:small subunit ribosomal protein S18
MAKKMKPMRRPKLPAPAKDYFVENKLTPHYSNVTVLSRFLSDRGKILPRSRSGLTAASQRKLEKAVKYARHLALLPFVNRD